MLQPSSEWRERALAELDGRLEARVSAPLAVAFSGGGDSVALMALAATWSARRGRRLLALTVDHGLHPDSARWTRATGEQASAMGAAWAGLAWAGTKPLTGLPAAARRARHALLAETARAAGAGVVLFGHTADDAREADFMRAEGAAIGRLRAWSPSPAWPEGRGVFLLRPLLGARRVELRAWLAAQGIGWRDDPANVDPRFARARARAALARQACDLWQEDLVECSRGAPSPGWTATADGRLRTARHGLETAAVSAALLSTSGGVVPPRAAQLTRLLGRLRAQDDEHPRLEPDRGDGEGGFTASLAGARLRAWGAAVELTREAGEIARGGLAPVALTAGTPTVWDGRFEIVSDRPGLTAAAVAGRAARLSGADRERLRAFPPAARAALPLLACAGGVSLPRPFGEGPGQARSLAGERFAAATGAVTRERDIPP